MSNTREGFQQGSEKEKQNCSTYFRLWNKLQEKNNQAIKVYCEPHLLNHSLESFVACSITVAKQNQMQFNKIIDNHPLKEQCKDEEKYYSFGRRK